MTASLVKPQKLPQARFTIPEIERDFQDGVLDLSSYLYLLVNAKGPTGTRYRIPNVTAFCKERGIPRSSFYRAVNKLTCKGRIRWEALDGIDLINVGSDEVFHSPPDTCLNSETGVSNLGHSDPDLRHSDPDLRHSDPDLRQSPPEIVSGKDFQDSSTLYYSLLLPTTTERCVEKSGEVKEDRSEVEGSGSPQVKSATDSNSQPKDPEVDQFSALPPLLQKIQSLGCNLNDRPLQSAIATFPERVSTAVSALEEKQVTVKSPTRFLEKAIRENWRPEKVVSPPGWKEWFEEAYRRKIAIAGFANNGTQMVILADEHQVPFEQVRRQTWDELEARLKNPIDVEAVTVKDLVILNPAVIDLSDALAELNALVQQMQWSADQKSTFIQQHFDKHSISQLTDAHVFALLELLREHSRTEPSYANGA
jgi:hypothetical protein